MVRIRLAMTTASMRLPEDPAGPARRGAGDARRTRGRARTAPRLEDQNERLRHIIRQLQRAQFGRRSEKLDPDQLQLALEELEQARAPKPTPKRRRRTPALRRARGRERGGTWRPARAPAADRGGDRAGDDARARAARGAMHVIGEERSERLDVIPAQYA